MKTTTTKQTLDCPGAGGSPFTARAKRIATGVLTAAALLSTACGNDDSGGDPYVTISPATAAIAFSAEAAESYTYKVSTNQPVWLPITDQSWCKVEMNPSEGTFTVTALPNDKTAAPPPATITVTAGKAAPVTINATQEAAAECDVYVSGSYQTADYNTFACYWKNGVQKALPVPSGTVDSHCTSIAASGGSIYLSGNMGGTGCYWKDGEVHIAGQLYISALGYSANIATYWKDGNAKSLTAPVTTNESDAMCMACSGGSVYIGGCYSSEGVRYPCYWVGEACTPLTDVPQGMDDCSVQSIAVVNGTVYAAGTCMNSQRDAVLCWTNGKHTELPLPAGAYNAKVPGIAVAGGKVFVAGQYQDRTNKTCACYWVNGRRTDLPKGTDAENFFVTGIAVVKR
ncbi:BACON domain-containing protein [Alistipes sp.]|uniref:BACON domain-containing protein n=1 Tax=Alistipes sp. TaxID=1872444 RepID=UPI003AEFC199